METENPTHAALPDVQTLKHNVELRRQNEALRAEARRWHDAAEKERADWIRVHNAMNLLRQDAQNVLDEHGATPVHRELQATRERLEKLTVKWQRVRQFARQAVETKAIVAQKARDLDSALLAMKDRMVQIEEERDAVSANASEVVARRDEQLKRIQECCTIWRKGYLAPADAVASIASEVGGYKMLSATELERYRAAQHAQALSMLNEESNKVTRIEVMLDDADIPGTGDAVKQVRELLKLYKAAEKDNYALWGLIEDLAKKVDAPELADIAERYDAEGLKSYVGGENG
jgi:hypothetical protein